MNNRIQRGNVAELIVATEASRRGFVVLLPISHNCHYDLVIDNGNKLRRVQVKRAYKVDNHGKKTFCVESRRISGKKRLAYPDDGYDVLIAVDVDGNRLWIIPFCATKEYKAQIYLETEKATRFLNDWSLI